MLKLNSMPRNPTELQGSFLTSPVSLRSAGDLQCLWKKAYGRLTQSFCTRPKALNMRLHRAVSLGDRSSKLLKIDNSTASPLILLVWFSLFFPLTVVAQAPRQPAIDLATVTRENVS